MPAEDPHRLEQRSGFCAVELAQSAQRQQPARFEAVQKFLDYAAQHRDIWIASRTEIARHWIATHPAEQVQ